MIVIKNEKYTAKNFNKQMKILVDKHYPLEIVMQKDITKKLAKKIVDYKESVDSIISSRSNSYKKFEEEGIDFSKISDKELAKIIYEEPGILRGVLVLDDVFCIAYNSKNINEIA